MSRLKDSEKVRRIAPLNIAGEVHDTLASPRRYQLTRRVRIPLPDGTSQEIDCADLKEIRFIGEGRYGEVYEMKYEPLNLTFAVKRIKDHNNEEPGTSRKQQTSEIMELSVLLELGTCPHLIKFYGALHTDSKIWILTELMDTSIETFYLKALDKKKKISELFMSKLSYSVLQALIVMKEKGFMHRDIKPSNILINYNGEIKVCDFGISGRVVNSVTKTIGRGCLPYMPKEKIVRIPDKEGYTIKTDVWSLGISLIEVVTGIHPYSQYSTHFSQTQAIVDNPSPKLDDSFSPSFREFVERCLAKEEVDRWDPQKLLDHNFIQQYVDRNDHIEFVQSIIDEIRHDNAKSENSV